MRIAITGATGFIGGYMTRGFLAAGHQVRVLVRPGRESALEVDDPEAVEFHQGDLTDGDSIKGFLKDCDRLVHLASAHDHFSKEHMQLVNVKGTEHLIEEAKRYDTSEFLFIVVSSAVIGVPVYSYYRDSKRVQEKIIRGSGLHWASFRPTLVYGKGDFRHTAPLLRRCGAQKGNYWVYHEGLSKLSPVHVDDMVDVMLRYFNYDRALEDYRVFEIAGPEGIPFNDFIDQSIAAAGGKVKRRNIPRRWVERAIFLKGLFMDVTRERRGAGYFSLHHEHDIRPAQNDLGWQPRPFDEGIRQVAEGDWWHETGEREGEAVRLGTGGV
ncbi:MAG: nucleoside-diphosphate-sugar epimerase [Planctomycetota bacterium]|jgi:nucleoside-diphosphate-sugar epimerase